MTETRRPPGSQGWVEPFGGLILAMETAGREGSAALATSLDGDRTRLEILARTSLRAEEEHASLLVPRIQALMEEVGADGSELSGIVVGAGPGSFTGVRVAAATAKGFARALNLPLWAFSSLAAAAVNGESPGWTVAEEGGAGAGGRDPGAETVGGRAEGAIAFRGMRSTGGSPFDALRPRCVLFDARGDRVYLAAYRLDGGRLATLLEPRAATVREVMEEQLLPPGSLLLGDGALRHRAILEEAGHPVLPPPFGQPSAVGLIHLLSYDPDAAPLEDPGRWEPEYLRASGAERMWKTRKGMGL